MVRPFLERDREANQQQTSRGHQLLMVTAQKCAGDGELRIYPSRFQDAKKNPVHPKQKHHFLRLAFSSLASCFVDNERVRTALDVLTIASNEGFQKAVMVVGSDRLETFIILTAEYNGDLYCLEGIHVDSCGDRDPDADGVERVSGTQMRKAAVEADFNAFLRCLPDAMSTAHARELFNAVADNLAKKTPEGFPFPRGTVPSHNSIDSRSSQRTELRSRRTIRLGSENRSGFGCPFNKQVNVSPH